MGYFFIALINPIAHSIANHIDKYIISKYIKDASVGSIILFSSLFSALVIPILFILNPNILNNIPFNKSLILAANGSLIIIAMILYFYALAEEETSFVAPLFQLIPIFGFILSYFILNETLTINQLIGCFFIILGGVILSLKFSNKIIVFKKKLLILMAISSFLYAINGVIFKLTANNLNFQESIFWDMVGKFIFGIIIFICIKKYRKDFISTIRSNKLYVIFIFSLNEGLAIFGDIALFYAILLHPVAIIQSISGLQPLFVFILGVFITIFFPKIASESLNKNIIIQKIAGITIISLGVVLLS